MLRIAQFSIRHSSPTHASGSPLVSSPPCRVGDPQPTTTARSEATIKRMERLIHNAIGGRDRTFWQDLSAVHLGELPGKFGCWPCDKDTSCGGRLHRNRAPSAVSIEGAP